MDSSSARASGRPAAARRRVTWCSPLSVATAIPAVPPERSASRAPSSAYPTGSSLTSQTSISRPASSTTATVNQALVELRAAAGGADARPQYTRTSATASSSSPTSVAMPGLMLPGEGSVAPVHGAGDLADYRAPTERCGFCPDFLELASSEEATQAATFGRPQRLVEVVKGRTGGEGGDDRVDPQRVPEIARHLTGLDHQVGVPAVPAAAQVLHHEVQLIGVLV